MPLSTKIANASVGININSFFTYSQVIKMFKDGILVITWIELKNWNYTLIVWPFIYYLPFWICYIRKAQFLCFPITPFCRMHCCSSCYCTGCVLYHIQYHNDHVIYYIVRFIIVYQRNVKLYVINLCSTSFLFPWLFLSACWNHLTNYYSQINFFLYLKKTTC